MSDFIPYPHDFLKSSLLPRLERQAASGRVLSISLDPARFPVIFDCSNLPYRKLKSALADSLHVEAITKRVVAIGSTYDLHELIRLANLFALEVSALVLLPRRGGREAHDKALAALVVEILANGNCTCILFSGRIGLVIPRLTGLQVLLCELVSGDLKGITSLAKWPTNTLKQLVLATESVHVAVARPPFALPKPSAAGSLFAYAEVFTQAAVRDSLAAMGPQVPGWLQ